MTAGKKPVTRSARRTLWIIWVVIMSAISSALLAGGASILHSEAYFLGEADLPVGAPLAGAAFTCELPLPLLAGLLDLPIAIFRFSR